MGGRGSASGMSDKGKLYGTEYTTLHQSGNIKFVRYNNGAATAPVETMTKGRIYATVSAADTLKSIVYFDKHNKRYKQLDVGHLHKVNGIPTDPHVHKGYLHGEKGTRNLSPKELKILERAEKIWYNYLGRQ